MAPILPPIRVIAPGQLAHFWGGVTVPRSVQPWCALVGGIRGSVLGHTSSCPLGSNSRLLVLAPKRLPRP